MARDSPIPSYQRLTTHQVYSAEYQKLLQHLVDDFEDFEGNLDIRRKKEILEIIFKRLADGQIASFELYDSHNDNRLKEPCQSACVVRPTVSRRCHCYTGFERLWRDLALSKGVLGARRG